MAFPYWNRSRAEIRGFALLALGAACTMTMWISVDWLMLLLQVSLFCIALLAAPPLAPALLIGFVPLWGVLQLTLHLTAIPWPTVRSALQWSATAATCWAALSAVASAKPRSKFLRGAALFAVALCTFSLIHFFTAGQTHFWFWGAAEPQVFGPFQSRNNFASFALLMLPLVLWEAVERYQTAWGWVMGGALMAGAVAASGSRAGAALMLVELVAFAILARKRLNRNVVFAGTCLVVAAVCIAGWAHLAGKLGDADPWRYRREMVRSAIQMSRDKPFTGHGLGTYPSVYPSYALFDSGHRVNHAHNDWAEWASEGGLPPLAALLLLLLPVMIAAATRFPWAIGLLFVCAHALVDYPFQRLGVSFWFVVLAAAVYRESATFEQAPLRAYDG